RHLLYEEVLTVGYQNLSGAYSINDQISVGGGLNFVGAWVQLKQKIPIAPGVEIPVVLGGTASTTAFSLSGFYDNGSVAAGLTYSPGYVLNGEGNVQFDTSAAPGFTPMFPDGGVQVDIPIPSLLEMGVSWRNKPKDHDYQLELDVVRTGWSAYKELRIKFTSGMPVSETVQEKNWKDTMAYKLGGNYSFLRSETSVHRLRGGVMIDESPIPANTLDPAVPDGTGRFNFAFGYGFSSGELDLELGYLVSKFKASKAEPDPGSDLLPARYRGRVFVTSLSAAYRF
ncbi:MAG: outer membrane protein transport protein, partial [Deltaproteobacteria bacterium]|nr:outer membrane protein transport protein [Deltaproteobacteria bacterium]